MFWYSVDLSLLTLAIITIFVLALLDVYAVEIFFILMAMEFVAFVQLTNPRLFKAAWRKNITVFVAICFIVFLVIIYQKLLYPA